MYNIPQTLLDRVKRAMKLDETEFEIYIASLENEARSFIKNLLYIDFDSLKETDQSLFVSFYLQYALYAKIEKDEISEDKLRFLQAYIDGYNVKTEKERIEARTKDGGVKFL